MSAKDYAGRRTPKTKRRTSKKSSASNRLSLIQRLPLKALCAFLMLSSAFAYFLFKIQSSPADVAPNATLQSQKVQPKIPKPPEEKWTYLDELPKKEVKVEVKTNQKKTRPYKMQCGSFRTYHDAEVMQAKIAFLDQIIRFT